MGNKVIVLSGITASGKTTVGGALEKLGYCRIITYTTRKPREDEVQDVSYHFISEEDFMKKKEQGFFAEWRSYDSASGKVFYGSAKEDYKKDHIFVILDPEGAKTVKELFGKEAVIVYINTHYRIVQERLKKRGDSKEEIEKRLDSDLRLFDYFGYVSDIVLEIRRDVPPERLAKIIDEYA